MSEAIAPVVIIDWKRAHDAGIFLVQCRIPPDLIDHLTIGEQYNVAQLVENVAHLATAIADLNEKAVSRAAGSALAPQTAQEGYDAIRFWIARRHFDKSAEKPINPYRDGSALASAWDFGAGDAENGTD